VAIPRSNLPIDLHLNQVVKICQEFGVQDLRIFGSVLRADFHGQSDIDVLCTLRPDSSARGLGWIDLLLALEDVWGRSVDLVKPHLLDPVIREDVLREAQTIYVAPS
jgi:hypothetical protein